MVSCSTNGPRVSPASLFQAQLALQPLRAMEPAVTNRRLDQGHLASWIDSIMEGIPPPRAVLGRGADWPCCRDSRNDHCC